MPRASLAFLLVTVAVSAAAHASSGVQCCVPDGQSSQHLLTTCQVVATSFSCEALGGVALEDLGTCQGDPCEEFFGGIPNLACCTASDCVFADSFDQCQNLGGRVSSARGDCGACHASPQHCSSDSDCNAGRPCNSPPLECVCFGCDVLSQPCCNVAGSSYCVPVGPSSSCPGCD